MLGLMVASLAAAYMSTMKRGRDCDPFRPTAAVSLMAHLYMMRRYDEASAEARKLLELNFPVRPWLARVLWQKGMYEEAMAEYRKSLTRDPELLDALARGYADSGPRSAMRAAAEFMVARSKERYIDPFPIASFYARGEEVDRALEWLEKAYEERTPELL